MRDPTSGFTPFDAEAVTAVQDAGAFDAAPAPLIAIIQQTWEAALGVARAEPTDDFFDIGGNSLIAGNAVAMLGAKIGIDLPLRAIFEAPTPAEMADLILEKQTRRTSRSRTFPGITPVTPEWLVPLQPKGTLAPVWLVPGGVGGVWTLKRDAKVAALVGDQRPFYGFQRDPPQLDLRRPDWISATAALYVQQMRNLQRAGPFLIYGICSGGALAWEVATQLANCGEEIAGVLLYESALAPDFASQSPRRGRRMMPYYAPSPLPVDLTLLMTETWHAADRSAGWRQVALGLVTTVVMPGSTPGAHNLYINREPMIADRVRAWIERSEARVVPE
ncbi:MAG: phosphopantetheine-binding protein [Thermomicrobiales bacterium]